MCAVLEAYNNCLNIAIAILLAMFLSHFIVAQLEIPCVAIHGFQVLHYIAHVK